MVSVEFLPNVVEGQVEHLPAQVDGDLARIDDVARALLSHEISKAHLVKRPDFLLDVRNGQALGWAAGEVVLQKRPYVAKV